MMLDTASDQTSTIPRVPLLLGLGGLIPFWGGALASIVSPPFGLDPQFISNALAVYAATIASFLGGIRWGIAVRDTEQRRAARDYAIAVVPQLLAWSAMALSDRWRFAALGLLILILGPLDRGLVRQHRAPAWFGRLRMILTLGAGAALFVAALR